MRDDGHVLKQWKGRQALAAAPVRVAIRWRTDGRTAGVPAGIYRLRLRAGIEMSIGNTPDHDIDVEQTWSVAVGLPRPAPSIARAPALSAAPAPAGSRATLYTVHLGNLHSQTNHSDGGGALGRCSGSQAPQSAALGPTEAYDFARRHGLDFLMTSEHNHMFDGSGGTNAGADPATVKALYQSGIHAANTWNLAHPGFLAMYGQEWGVIDHGGHLNILNGGELLGWERNAAGDLLADTATPRNDYATLYALMRQRGWLGQFNHPRGDQFAIDGKPLAWTPDGDAAMVLCEVLNSNAFSNRDDESEPRHSTYEAGCNKLLEAGYHVAFSSNQDNHCANWGASSSNRTGVLIERGDALTADTFVAALTARRVYATMDKNAELVLTANGRMMGERFDNRGRLTLQVRYAGRRGQRPAAINVFAGVPGRNGEVKLLSRKASTVLTPTAGAHFYYARVTQNDGKMLWSAPIWIHQTRR
ncbi:CehA/McbA family metallohydrolase [Duganella sp. CF517]|uniref:CehA/McbA family metallohydrolase n=1 Tax=Duganella sp. CF517 TaxID=1881038 RepID=UPI001E61BF4E|nr:CehA/McbA family metallohydrolase [Duganella sp. CF517]